jgi:uncharacterized membrane protein YbhN (UPF0104 family)
MIGQRSTLRAILTLVPLTALLLWVGWYVWEHQEAFVAITHLSVLSIVPLYALYALALVCNGLLFKVVLDAFGGCSHASEWLALSVATSFTNYCLPVRGGTALRAFYMSRMYHFPLTDFITTLSAMYLIHMVTNGLLALGGLQLAHLTGMTIRWQLVLFFLLVSLGGLFVLGFDYRRTTVPPCFPLKQLHPILVGWRQVRTMKRLLVQLWIITLLLTLVTIWQCKLAFAAFSLQLSWGGVLLYTASKNLALLVSLTPGAFGIMEGISIYLGGVLGYTTAEALMVQGLIRAVSISTLLLTGPVSLMLLKTRVTTHRQERYPAATPHL